METVNVVVTCTKDKKHSVADDCRLRSLPGGTLRARASDWRRRLTRRRRERVLVRDLYAGDHWSNVRSFNSLYFDVDVWVCSAGYGLVRIDDEITPYDATFSSNHPDSVGKNVTDVDPLSASSRWWESLTKWKGHFKDRPRSLKGLFATYPNRSTIVVTSDTYMRAVAGDLRQAAIELNDPDLLSIVSAGVRKINGLNEYLIPCDARLQNAVNGARRSLNTRIANKIIREAKVPPRHTRLARKYKKLLSEQPPIPTYGRTPMSDEEVRRYIHKQLKSDSTLPHTRLLRRLRDDEKACEQKRFATLYREVREQIDGA